MFVATVEPVAPLRLMPLSPDQLGEMNHRGVIVTTHSGAAVGMGSLHVSAVLDGGLPRVDLHFETVAMRCVLGVPQARLEQLARSWNGSTYRYALPPGDKVWLPEEHSVRAASGGTTGPFVETFPLPTSVAPAPVIGSPRKKGV